MTDRWQPNTDYAAYPDNDLYGVPEVILDASRAVVRSAAAAGKVDPDLADPIAASLVGVVLKVARATSPTTSHDVQATMAAEAARALMQEAVVWKDADPAHADSVADTTSGAVLPLIREWLAERTQV